MGVKNLKAGLFDEIKYLSKKGHYILGICWYAVFIPKSEESESDMTGLSLLKGGQKNYKK